MPVTSQQLFSEWESSAPKPVYLVHGDEPFQINECIQRLHLLQRQGSVGLSLESFDPETQSLALFQEALESFGLFDSANKVLLVQRWEKADAEWADTLLAFLEKPPSGVWVVLTATKIDKRKAWFRQVEQKGLVMEVFEPFDRDLPRWWAYFDKRLGKTVDAAVWDSLRQVVGRSLNQIWLEIQKLACFVGERNRITRKDLDLFWVQSNEQDVFAFVDAVFNFQKTQTLLSLSSLLNAGESEIKLLSLLVRQLKLIHHYIELELQGVTDSKTLAGKLGMSPFFLPKVSQQARHFRLETLPYYYDLLAETDYRIKTGEGGIFEIFLLPFLASVDHAQLKKRQNLGDSRTGR